MYAIRSYYEWLYKMGNELDSSIVICNRGFELAKTNADSLNMVRLLLETAPSNAAGGTGDGRAASARLK